MSKPRLNKGQWSKGQSGNPNGRPRGSRNKSSLIKAQHKLDDGSEVAARLLNAIMQGDEELLSEFDIKPEEVTLKLRVDSAKIVLSQTANGMKTLEEKATPDTSDSEEGKPKENKPVFSRVSSV
jgi:hypothetical protein